MAFQAGDSGHLDEHNKWKTFLEDIKDPGNKNKYPALEGPVGPVGPSGPQGSPGAGVVVKGNVPDQASLPSSGNDINDAYVTDDTGHLWVWGGSAWSDIGPLRGPTGPQGPQGADSTIPGPQGPQGPAGPKGADSTVPGPQGDPGYPPVEAGDSGMLLTAGAPGAQPTWEDPPVALPSGGTTGQVLAKQSNNDGDTHWVDNQQSFISYEYTATAGQTVFTGNDNNGVALVFNADLIQVFLNGVLLHPGDDYTTSTNTVTLASGAALNDALLIAAFSSFEVANTYTRSEADAKFALGADLATVGINLTGVEVDLVSLDSEFSAHEAATGDTHGVTAGDEIVGGNAVNRIVKLTQAQYDGLTPVATTLYVIVG